MSAELLQQELEKVDVIRERTGLGFADARELLEATSWNVMDALILFDQSANKKVWEVRGQELVQRIKQIIKKGNVTNIRVKTNERVIVELPVTAGVVGTVIAPKLTMLAGMACLLAKCTVEFDQIETEH